MIVQPQPKRQSQPPLLPQKKNAQYALHQEGIPKVYLDFGVKNPLIAIPMDLIFQNSLMDSLHSSISAL